MFETEGRERAVTARDPRLAAWRAFLIAHARILRRLDDQLREGHDLSLAEYDALLQIASAPGRRLRMTQLASRVLLSKSGVTRLIDRLVADGFVERSQCSHDARGADAVLTASGLERYRAAARTHLRGIERYFVSALSPADLAAIERAMEAVSRSTGWAGLPGDPEPSELADPIALPTDEPVRS